jgi:hypothetical protein
MTTCKNLTEMYKLGGLEPSKKRAKTLLINGTNYVVSDKFKSMLRDNFIDWGSFLDVYNKNLSITNMFDQMVKILNVKANENFRESMIPIIEKIYNLPADAHMACMVKQFMIFEPVSAAIHELFTIIKLHFEYIFEKFLITRNLYIEKNKLSNNINNLESLQSHWESYSSHYDSSSIKLLFLNPPDNLLSGLNFNVDGLESVIKPLRSAVKGFKYLGFCPKVPHQRINALLLFPINEFINAIRTMDTTATFSNYSDIEVKIKSCLHNIPKAPVVIDNIKRKKIPPNITDTIDISKWYIDNILDIRKQLIKYGSKFEEYYTKHAKIIMNLSEILKKELLT